MLHMARKKVRKCICEYKKDIKMTSLWGEKNRNSKHNRQRYNWMRSLTCWCCTRQSRYAEVYVSYIGKWTPAHRAVAPTAHGRRVGLIFWSPKLEGHFILQLWRSEFWTHPPLRGSPTAHRYNLSSLLQLYTADTSNCRRRAWLNTCGNHNGTTREKVRVSETRERLIRNVMRV